MFGRAVRIPEAGICFRCADARFSSADRLYVFQVGDEIFYDSKSFNVFGSVMSLASGSGPHAPDHCFQCLFMDAYVRDASGLYLAESAGEASYAYMFCNSHLTLPIREIKGAGKAGCLCMFSGCDRLQLPPALP